MIKVNKAGISGQPTFILRDKDGNIKKIWNDNKLGRALLRLFRLFSSQSRLAIYGIRIPYIFGQWESELAIKNLLPSAGLAGIASRINGSGAEAAFTYLAVGTGTTAAAAGNTALETEITDSGLARASASCSRVTTTVTDDTAQLDKTWSVTGTKAVTECGALNAGAAGTLLGRQVFSAINVANGDSLQITYKFASANA